MKIIFLILWSMLSDISYAHEMPEHSRYQILISDPTTSTVTQESFNTIPQIVFSRNYPQFLKHKLDVSLKLMWEVPYFSAWVVDDAPKKYTISFWGGIARIPGMNDNALALITCHEIGHLLGGEPRSKLPAYLWASSEGQSDYYASSICLKDYFELLASIGKLDEPQVDKTLYTRCLTKFDETKDFLICLNTMNAIEGFSHVLYHLDPEKKEINYKKVSAKAKATNTNSYPAPQCRVETLIAGNLDSHRPQCWFVD